MEQERSARPCMTLALADNLINMLFVGADRKLHHLCCVPTSPRWSTSSQSFCIWKWNYKKSPGPFSYTLTALVVEACKLGLSFSCGVFTANCIVNIAITVNFECAPLSWNVIILWILQFVHKSGWDGSDGWCLHNNWPLICSQCFRVLSGHINYKSFPLDIAQKWPKIITMKPRRLWQCLILKFIFFRYFGASNTFW